MATNLKIKSKLSSTRKINSLNNLFLDIEKKQKYISNFKFL
jgi:hypothetical protein